MLPILQMNFFQRKWKEAELENDELTNYKAKAEYYIRQHQDNIVIAKLTTDQPLTCSRYGIFGRDSVA